MKNIKINFIKQMSGNYIFDNSIVYTKEEAIFIKQAIKQAIKQEIKQEIIEKNKITRQ
jgi:hypothetical protein